MDSFKVEIITRDFNRMLEEFAAIEPRIEFSDIIRGVALRVLAGCVRRTRSAKAERIKLSWGSREWITFEGKKIRLGYTSGESWFLHDDALWNRIKNFRGARLQAKLGAVGLSKRSWLLFEQDLRGGIDSPAYVRAAAPAHFENARTVETGSSSNYALRLINSSPIVQRAGGESALIGSMAAETRYFFTLLAKGAFRTAESRARKYPGVYIHPAPLAMA